ncbi:DUF6259 domain-containing protein [Cohnella sp.]|uniref:DUF6259 domain-containing protein n=1 Tax=Cohnella sp. TaxID=1883426 RepID=UPI003704D1F6
MTNTPIRATFLVMVMTVLLLSSFQMPKMASAAVSTVYSNSGGTITLSNTLIELKWKTTNGTLIGLKNKTSGTQHLGGALAGNWTLFANTTTANKWNASLGTMFKGRDADLSSVNATTLTNGIRVDLAFHGVGGKNISVIQHVTVYDNDPVSHWTTEVVNNEPNSTVTAVVTPQLTGVQALSGESLMWPYKEGEIFSNPGTFLRMMQYPVPASMQWMNLYNNNEGLYYAVLDTTAAYKEFRFGYDAGLDPSAGSPRQMSATVWPFAETNDSYISPQVDIGVASEGGWYWGADRYRDWLINKAQWEKGKPTKAMELDAWYMGNVKAYNGSINLNYSDLPGYIQNVDSKGIHNLEVTGWHVDGFDSYYPDYYTLSAAGGDTGLEDAVADIHANGDNIFFYINNHIADIGSDWYASHAGVSNLQKVDGTYFPESYGNGRSFYAMSPHSSAWISQLKDRANFLRDIGADGIWWDQMAEMDAVLDYNSAAGHSSPATSFSEGYKEMMDAIHWDFSSHGTNTNYVFAMEGVSDYYSYFVDLNGMMWGRSLGYVPQQAPQVTRYTIPAKFLGLPTAGKAKGSLDEYAWAFTMGNPLLVDTVTPNANVFPRYTDIYKSEPTIYFYGTYKDERGLSLSNSNIKGTTIVGENQDRLGIQLRNLSSVSQTVTVTLDYAKLGLAGSTVGSVVNIEGGAVVAYTTGANSVSLTITIPANDVKALKISF